MGLRQLLMGFVLGLVSWASAVGDAPCRIATFNVSMSRRNAGELWRELHSNDHSQAKKLAAIIQKVRPDVLVLNEFDYTEDERALEVFVERYLGNSQDGQERIEYAFRFTAPVNTGEPSGMDLDGDANPDGPGDAYGFGYFPGNYGMAVLSRWPIDKSQARTFQKFLWKDLPNASRPRNVDGTPFHDDRVWSQLRLSSKSHWSIPIDWNGQVVHLLVSHPTPPVFDGPEDRNGCRNLDEIRFWKEYLDPVRGESLYDDRGVRGGLRETNRFVIVGDLNADPHDGDSRDRSVQLLLSHPRVIDPLPVSVGAVEAAARQAGANDRHRGAHELDTADFADGSVGNLRIDYVLPGRPLTAIGAGVFWPADGEAGHEWINASDHRLVWVDVQH